MIPAAMVRETVTSTILSVFSDSSVMKTNHNHHDDDDDYDDDEDDHDGNDDDDFLHKLYVNYKYSIGLWHFIIIFLLSPKVFHLFHWEMADDYVTRTLSFHNIHIQR